MWCSAECKQSNGFDVSNDPLSLVERVTPLRIAYHPDTVLEVVHDSPSQVNAIRETASLLDTKHDHGRSQECHTNDNSACCQPASDHSTHIHTSAQNMATLTIADTETDSHSLITYPVRSPEGVQSRISKSNHLYNSYLSAIMTGQEMQAATIKQSIDVGFDRLQAELEKNKELQGQLLSTQQEMQQLQQQTREELVEKQNEIQQIQTQTKEELLEKQQQMLQLQGRILQMQQMALDRLAIIQNKIQALLVQTYELHEYPIPRLFIVLPKTVGLVDRISRPFSHKFRLYFLCECGSHTMTENSKVRHEVHLAKHEGYGLEKPTEFFERYGSYVLTLMHMIKYGMTIAGIVVPPLASSRLVNEIDTAKKHMEYIKKNIAPLVDDTINFLNGIKRNNESGGELTEDHAESDQLEALEGADLRQLEYYLRIKDQGRVLGNLYRIVTQEGHVKWVCFDHYRATYHESMVQQLRDVIDVNKGTFIEEIGRIEITITSSVLAKQFYQALVNARGIQELEITLEWDASMDDLRSLANAATKSNLLHFSVDGTNFKGPALDIVNRAQRFDPILRLASNARMQSLRLKGFDDFFSRISKSALAPAPKLRVFSLDSKVAFKDKSFKSFKDFLSRCSALTSMELRIHPQDSLGPSSDIFSKIRNLASLKISRGELSVSACISSGKIQDINMTFKRFSDLSPDDIEFIQQGHFIRLTIEYTPQGTDERLLDNVLLHSSALNHVQIISQERCVAIATTLESTLQGLMEVVASKTPSVLDSFAVDCRRLSLTTNYSQGTIRDMSMIIAQLADFSHEDLTFIKQNQLTQLAIESTLMKDDEDRLADIIRNSSELRQFRIEIKKENHRIARNESELRIQDFVRITTFYASKKLESLSFSCARLSLSIQLSQGCIRKMAMTIVQLGDLNSDDVRFIQQGRLTGLVIEQIPLKSDSTRLADILRRCERLTHLHFVYKEKHHLVTTIERELKLQELVEMVTACSFNRLKSLKIDWDGHSLTANISSGKIQDVSLTVKRAGDLSSSELMFIQKDHITKLAIKDLWDHEEQVDDFLIRYPKLSELKLGCVPELCCGIVNLLVMTRGKLLNGSGSCLRTLELMEPGLIPFDMLDCKDRFNSYIQATLTFAKDSNSFDMHSWVRIGDFTPDKDLVVKFVRQYGWSIVSFYEGMTENTFTVMLDEVDSKRNTQLVSLHMDADVLRTLGFDRVDRIMQRSGKFKELGMMIPIQLNDPRKWSELFNRYGKRMSILRMDTLDCGRRIPQLAPFFPSRNSFPNLASFDLRAYSGVTVSDTVPSSCMPWIIAMISPPRRRPHRTIDSPSSQTLSHSVETPAAHNGSKTESWTVLKKIVLRIKIQPEEWRSLIDAIDFSALQHLDLDKCNILQEHLKQIVNCIPDNKGSVAPLKTLVIKNTRVANSADSRAVLDELRRKVPLVRIVV